MLKEYIKIILETINKDDRVVLWDFIQENFISLGFETLKENRDTLLLQKEVGIKKVIVEIFANFSWRATKDEFPTVSVIDVKFYEFDERLRQYAANGFVNVDHQKIELGDVDIGYTVYSVEFRTNEQRPFPNRRLFERSEWKEIVGPKFYEQIGISARYITDYGVLDEPYMNFPEGTFVVVYPSGRNYVEYIFVQKQPNLEETMKNIIALKKDIIRFLKNN